MATVPGDALRRMNEQRVVSALRVLGAASRAQLVQHSGLSRATISSIAADLQQRGILVESGQVTPESRGRPSALLRLAPPQGRALAVDVGFSHVRAVVADATGRAVCEAVRELPEGTDIGRVLTEGGELVREVLAADGVDASALVAVVVGVPSPVDLAGRPVGRHLRHVDVVRLLGLVDVPAPARVCNDAYLAAVGEAVFGNAHGLRNMVYVKVSHGLGSGLILDGRPYRGSGFAGNLGHVRVQEGGAVCVCGNRGCLETLVSTDALVRALQPAHPELRLTTADLLRLGAEGDPGTHALVSDAGRTIGRTLAEVVTMLNPDGILVGGSLSALGDSLLDGVRESLRRYAQPTAVAGLLVTRASLRERAAALGGIAIAFDLVEE